MHLRQNHLPGRCSSLASCPFRRLPYWHLYRTIVLRNDQTVTLAQDDVGITAWVRQCFWKVDTYRVFARNIELLYVGALYILRGLGECTGIVAAGGKLQKIFLHLFALHLQYCLHLPS